MKKIILVLVVIILLTGCTSKDEITYSKYTFETIVDKETCVEYYASAGYYNAGTVSVKYNADGTIKLNKECLKGDDIE